jgi:U3 small nucleolar RNA-associated protein 19
MMPQNYVEALISFISKLMEATVQSYQIRIENFTSKSSCAMPGIAGDSTRPAKRKRVSSDKDPSKRARSESSDENALAQILLLEKEILESKKNYNNIVKLIKILRSDSDDIDDAAVAAISLCRVFIRLIAFGELEKKKDSTDKDLVVIKWLRERYLEYKTALLTLVGEDGIGNTALELSMRMLKTEGEHIRNGREYNFPTTFLTDIIRVLLSPGTDETIRKEFSEKYVEEYDDVRFYTFGAIELA